MVFTQDLFLILPKIEMTLLQELLKVSFYETDIKD